MQNYRLAFLPLARTTFDLDLAREVTEAARTQLASAGFELLGPKELITDLASAQEAASQLSGGEIDLLLIYQATFADSTMVTAEVERSEAPVFLWAVPEPRTGGRLRLNSLCGINLAGHALTLRGLHYDYAYAPPSDPQTLAQIRALAAAGNLRRRLKGARLGVVGEHPAGMDTCRLDEAMLKQKFGIQVEHIALPTVFERARQTPEPQVAAIRSLLDVQLDNLAELEQAPLCGTLGVYTALQEIAAERGLDALAVRCWPEFFTELGCSACGAMSMLSEGFGDKTPIPCSCEADVNGSITQLMLQWLADAPAFGSDVVAMDFAEDVIALWHCGLAPLSMAEPTVQPRGTIHSNRRLPLVMEFPLKAGHVTIARLSQATGEPRLVLSQGEMLVAPPPFSGTSGTLRLEKPARRFFDALLQEGLEHHISLVYGDYLASLLALARLLDLPVLRL